MIAFEVDDEGEEDVLNDDDGVGKLSNGSPSKGLVSISFVAVVVDCC